MNTTDKPRVLPQPTISGPRVVRVGSASFGVPASAGVASAAAGKIVYVLFRARIHCFIEAGELEIPPAIRSRLASRYFGRAKR